MAETSTTPVATGTPSGAAPAATGNGAGNTSGAEPGGLDDLLLAELEGESGTETQAGDGDTDNSAGSDGADESQEQETGDGKSPEDGEGEGGEDGDGQEDDDGNDEGEGEEGEESGEEGAETGGMPKGVRQELENAKVGKGLLKRIDNAFKQNATHRARIGALETELAERGDPVVLAPTPRHPLSDIRTEAELTDRTEGAEWWLEWCDEHPEGGTLGTGDKAREFTAEDVKSQKQWAKAVLREAPKRQAWIGERAKAEAVARKAFPEMFRKGSPEFTAAEALTKGTPELVNQPDYHIVMADMVRGLKARVLESQGYKVVIIPPGGKKGEADAAPKGGNGQAPVSPQKPNRPAPRPATTPTPPPGRVSGSKPDVNAAAVKAAQTGNVDDLLLAELGQ